VAGIGRELGQSQALENRTGSFLAQDLNNSNAQTERSRLKREQIRCQNGGNKNIIMIERCNLSAR
jgi:hypothetical protein